LAQAAARARRAGSGPAAGRPPSTTAPPSRGGDASTTPSRAGAPRGADLDRSRCDAGPEESRSRGYAARSDRRDALEEGDGRLHIDGCRPSLALGGIEDIGRPDALQGVGHEVVGVVAGVVEADRVPEHDGSPGAARE